jgi:hypothetical protein
MCRPQASIYLLLICLLVLESSCRDDPKIRSSDQKSEPEILIYVTLIPESSLFADIYMDGVIVASANRDSFAQISPPTGEHVFRAALDGYKAGEKKVRVLDRGKQQINFTLIADGGQ